jgi:hypothetical protein
MITNKKDALLKLCALPLTLLKTNKCYTYSNGYVHSTTKFYNQLSPLLKQNKKIIYAIIDKINLHFDILEIVCIHSDLYNILVKKIKYHKDVILYFVQHTCISWNMLKLSKELINDKQIALGLLDSPFTDDYSSYYYSKLSKELQCDEDILFYTLDKSMDEYSYKVARLYPNFSTKIKKNRNLLIKLLKINEHIAKYFDEILKIEYEFYGTILNFDEIKKKNSWLLKELIEIKYHPNNVNFIFD